METSAKTAMNVNEIFLAIGMLIDVQVQIMLSYCGFFSKETTKDRPNTAERKCSWWAEPSCGH